MSIRLSNEEIEAMQGISYFLRCLYIFAIRRYMDYQTGIVGIKRRISYQSLSEEMFIEPASGVHKDETGSPARAKIRRALQTLEKTGLIEKIKNKDHIVFRCILARQGYSVQNQVGTPSIHQVGTQADTHQIEENLATARFPGDGISQADTQVGIGENYQVGTPLVKDNYLYIKSKDIVHSEQKAFGMPNDIPSVIPSLMPCPIQEQHQEQKQEKQISKRFDEFWKVYPRKENKKKARIVWEKLKLDEKADLIINDVILRMEKHEPWKNEKFVPHATTYLNGERWEDQFITETLHERQPRNQQPQNSISTALNNLINSRTRRQR